MNQAEMNGYSELPPDQTFSIPMRGLGYQGYTRNGDWMPEREYA